MPLARSIVSDPDELSDLREAWADLLARSASNEPMLSPTWLLPWWRVFGPLGGRALRVGVFRDEGRLVGIAPLLSRRHWYAHALPFRRIEMLGSGERIEDEICSEYLNVIAERGAERAVASALADGLAAGEFGVWDEVSLAPMDGRGVFPELLATELRRTGAAATVENQSVAHFITLPATWEAFLVGLSSTTRYLVTRSLRDFDSWAAGRAVFRSASSPGELAEGRNALVALHGERWGGEGVFGSPLFSAFHDAAMPALLARNALDLTWIEVDGKPISAIYNVVWGDKVYFYQSGRSLALPKKLRPGIVMHAHAIRRAIEAGRREYDFLGGTSHYKRQIAPTARELVRVRAVRPSLLETARLLSTQALAGARSVAASPLFTKLARPFSRHAAGENGAATRSEGQKGARAP